MLHTLLDDVGNHQIVENIVFPRVRYRDAEELLRSMQIQDPDNQVSDPTDLAVKPDVNRFRIMMGILIKC